MEPDDDPPLIQTIRFTAGDGVELVGDLSTPDSPRAAATVCHPHPEFGGDRHNNVVQALFDALPRNGVTTLRFDFRNQFDDGRGETLDAHAAIAEVTRGAPGTPVIAAGYSFGAMIALGLDHPAVTHRVLVAPPLGMIDIAPAGNLPTLVLSPSHDQFCPPETAEPIAATWGNTEFAPVRSADHFLLGATGEVTRRVLAWLDPQIAVWEMTGG